MLGLLLTNAVIMLLLDLSLNKRQVVQVFSRFKNLYWLNLLRFLLLFLLLYWGLSRLNIGSGQLRLLLLLRGLSLLCSSIL